MQQTETYKLNLIETSDTFSPAPLNENMEKVEAQFDAARAEAAAGDAALDQRVSILEGRKIVWGSYAGDGTTARAIDLGFTPEVVFAFPCSGSTPIYGMTIRGFNAMGGLTIVEGGFRMSSALNHSDRNFVYLAIL